MAMMNMTIEKTNPRMESTPGPRTLKANITEMMAKTTAAISDQPNQKRMMAMMPKTKDNIPLFLIFSVLTPL